MLRYKEEGCTTIVMKNGDTYRFNIGSYDELEAFILSGKSWWKGITYSGQRCIVKVGEIAGLVEHTAASLKYQDDETKEEKALEAIDG